MPNFFTRLFSGGAAKLIGGIGKVLDELETLKSEKEENDSFDMNVCNETKSEMEKEIA